MSTFHIYADGLNDGKVTSLIDFVNNTQGELTIGINSGGGSNAIRLFVQKLFEENQDRITLVGLVGVYSAAFELFYNFKGKRVMTDNLCGMVHRSYISGISIDSSKAPTHDEMKAMLSGMYAASEADEQFAQSFMTPYEFERYKKGDDVYFDFKRMKQIFPDVEVWE